MSDQRRRAGVKITGLFHDLVRKWSTVSVVWEDDPEKAIRELASAIATIPVKAVE
ncbi:MAG: hypothetical protein HXX15_18875 [Rhodopseudomonas sp.]|uniref:hypothetical protein n=1 Tax=Rhodopseudomonas sp. TaxID=1078 RepID=UPI00182B336A|nr:hypothetical protein [Rhodopseudomonas sp.]NVN88149.1 hypothetical protein [Rhodopseudomonas sp.]